MNGFVLGGGLAGLSAAMELSKNCDEVTVIEKENYLGGLASSYDIEGYMIPRFYRHVIDTDKVTLNLLETLKIKDKFLQKNVKFGIYDQTYDKIFQMSGSKLLFFKPLSFMNRIRFGFFALKLSLSEENIEELDKIDAETWLTNKASKGVSKFFGKLIAEHKFAIPFKEISAAWMYNRFKLEISKSKFIYYPAGKKGFDLLIDGLKDGIKGRILKETPVEKIIIENTRVKEIQCRKKRFIVKKDDLVINTIPIPIFLNLCKGLSETQKKKLQKIQYTANICLCFGCKENLTNYYWTNIIGNVPFGTIIDHNNMYDKYPWKVIYASNYVSQNNPILRQSDREILTHYVRHLEKIFKKDIKPLWYRVSKSFYATPTFRTNFFELIPNNRESENLRFAGPCMMYPEDRTMGLSIGSGMNAVKQLI